MTAEVDREFLRKLADWSASTDGVPICSLYLDIDGRRFPRRQDYLLRAEQLCNELHRQAEELPKAAQSSVAMDASRMLDFVRSLDRGAMRGVGLFSASDRNLWEEVLVPRPVRDAAMVAEHPYVMPLEALSEAYESFCTVLVDREKARLFLARMGRIVEQTDVADDVPGQHDQGGWSQARFQRHVQDHMGRHLKHVGDVLLAFLKHRGFDHLILGGPEGVVGEFEKGLHDYLKRRVVARLSLPMSASADEVLERSLGVEEELEAAREREVLGRMRAQAAAGRQAVVGLGGVLDALNEGRVKTLVVPFGHSHEGLRCTSCGRLALDDGRCPTCGGALERVVDVVDSAVAAALRQGSRVETLAMIASEAGAAEEIGALLRF